jgi:hypothetical protein
VKHQSSNTEDNDMIRKALRKLFVSFTLLFQRSTQTTPKDNIPADRTTYPNEKAHILDPVLIGGSKAVTLPVEKISRFILALVSSVLLIIPLTILSFQSKRRAHLITVVISTVVFCLLISLVSRSSNQEIMAAPAGYTAVLVGFVPLRRLVIVSGSVGSV